MDKLYSDLDVYLILKLIEVNHGRREMYKKAIKLMKASKPKVVRDVLQILLDNKQSDASTVLDTFCDVYLRVAEPAATINQLGFDGMVILDNIAYPITLHFESQEDYLWSVENEDALHYVAVYGALSHDWEFKVTPETRAEVVLFPELGYQGEVIYSRVYPSYPPITEMVSDSVEPVGRITRSIIA